MASTTLKNGHNGGNAAFPKQQLFILALCRICEPIAFMSIFPYIYYMVDSFKVTDDISRIAVYAGMVTSAFAFAEFSTGLVWGRLSDKIGRKPVLLTGLGGTALSMLLFGFAPNLPVALLARALGGLLNGNIGVLQTTVAEMITVKEHQPRAYTIMPFVWCLGSILGPTIGGALAEPCKSYPTLFAKGTIFERFPYLLPNLVCTVILAIGVVIGVLFLEETHAEKKHRRDVGIEVGNWLLTKMRNCTGKSSRQEKFVIYEEFQSLLNDEQPPGYRTTDGSPQLPVVTSAAEPQEPLSLNSCDSDVENMTAAPKPAVRKAFTKQVVLNIIGYGILAYHTMTFDQMMPVFLSTPDGDHAMRDLPFKFVGGFGLPTKQVGVILSMQGLYSMLAQIFLFPIVVRRLGELKTFRLICMSYPVLYFTTPYLVLLPDSLRLVGVYGVLIWKITFAVLAYPANAILLTNSAPSLLLLGTINGVAASTASLSRAFGPTVSGLLYTAGLKLGYSGLAWWCSAVVAILGAVLSLWMTDIGGRMAEKTDEDQDHEAAHLDHALDHTALEQAIEAADLMLDRPVDVPRRGSAIVFQEYEEDKH